MQKATIQVLLPLYQEKCIFTYCCNKTFGAGTLVLVPFREKKIWGIVWESDRADSDKISTEKLKDILAYKDMALSEVQIRLIKFISWYNLAPLGAVLKLFLPLKTFEFFTEETYAPNSFRFSFNLNTLSCDQQLALQQLQSFKGTSLLEGVTGSGKTEVYLHLIKEVMIKTFGQILIMLPEIMLTKHFLEKLSHKFGFPLVAWHSALSKKQRECIWQSIANQKTNLVIGSRSALFLPFKNLQLIIVDEEHDASYKQEERIIYNARDIAVTYGHFLKIPVVLASATPSVETMQNVMQGKYRKIELANRFGNVSMPHISIVDMKKEPLKKSKWLSESLIDATTNALSCGQQVLFFLNRKGYAPITMCKICGHKLGCKNCSACLVLYKNGKNHLSCHHCGYKMNQFDSCPNCAAANSFIHCGPGIDRLLEETQKLWPDKNIASITKDEIQKHQKDKMLLHQIASGHLNIIIGTQILSKGYHFPNLNLVGIIDADMGLLGADLKASERTYQLLTQVAGRAGREFPGHVIIQTYGANNNLLEAMKENNKHIFYQEELLSRQIMNMPPFSRLVAIIFSGKNEQMVYTNIKSFASQLKYTNEIEVLGPAQAPLAKINHQYRYRLLIKSATNTNIQSYIKQFLEKFKAHTSIKIKVDVDPCSFL